MVSLIEGSVGVMATARSSSLPLWNTAPARTSATRCGALMARQCDCAVSISLNAMAIPAAREPGPLVILLRLRTGLWNETADPAGKEADATAFSHQWVTPRASR